MCIDALWVSILVHSHEVNVHNVTCCRWLENNSLFEFNKERRPYDVWRRVFKIFNLFQTTLYTDGGANESGAIGEVFHFYGIKHEKE